MGLVYGTKIIYNFIFWKTWRNRVGIRCFKKRNFKIRRSIGEFSIRRRRQHLEVERSKSNWDRWLVAVDYCCCPGSKRCLRWASIPVRLASTDPGFCQCLALMNRHRLDPLDHCTAQLVSIWYCYQLGRSCQWFCSVGVKNPQRRPAGERPVAVAVVVLTAQRDIDSRRCELVLKV